MVHTRYPNVVRAWPRLLVQPSGRVRARAKVFCIQRNISKFKFRVILHARSRRGLADVKHMIMLNINLMLCRCSFLIHRPELMAYFLATKVWTVTEFKKRG